MIDVWHLKWNTSGLIVFRRVEVSTIKVNLPPFTNFTIYILYFPVLGTMYD